MTPYFSQQGITIYHSDCLTVLTSMPCDSVDAIVTDPPYGLSFMGKRWDYDVPGDDIWRECLRVLKPGGHLLAFAGTRTQHRMAAKIEDAGFEIRDMIAWLYGSGFPKSLNVSKAIDKSFRVEVESDAAKQWFGWGTALKPSMEPITVARKPLVGTVAENVLQHGTGAINVDGCRVGYVNEKVPDLEQWRKTSGGWKNTSKAGVVPNDNSKGRWPANLIHDVSDEVLAGFPMTSSGSRKAGRHLVAGGQGRYGLFSEGNLPEIVGDSGSAARFFYCAKSSKRDRDEGCEEMALQSAGEVTGGRQEGSDGLNSPRAGAGRTSGSRNHHPTVKPTELMRYLVRLVTPSGGIVLDPFMGSGSTGRAAKFEGFEFIGIEQDAAYVSIAQERIKNMLTQLSLGIL